MLFSRYDVQKDINVSDEFRFMDQKRFQYRAETWSRIRDSRYSLYKPIYVTFYWRITSKALLEDSIDRRTEETNNDNVSFINIPQLVLHPLSAHFTVKLFKREQGNFLNFIYQWTWPIHLKLIYAITRMVISKYSSK